MRIPIASLTLFALLSLSLAAGAGEDIHGYWRLISQKCSAGEINIPLEFATLFFDENGEGGQRIKFKECDLRSEFKYEVNGTSVSMSEGIIMNQECSDGSFYVFRDFTETYNIVPDEKGEPTLTLTSVGANCTDPLGVSTLRYQRIPQG